MASTGSNQIKLLDLPIDSINNIMARLPFRKSLAFARSHKWFSTIPNPLDRIDTNPLMFHDARIDGQAALCALVKHSKSRKRAQHLQILLKNPTVDPTYAQHWALIEACKNGKIDLVKVLLHDPRIDVSAQGNLPIQTVALSGSTEIFQLLLSHLKSNQEFLDAVRSKDLDKVKSLLKNSTVNPLVKKHSALYLAISNHDFEIFKELLQDPRFKSVKDNRLLIEIIEGKQLNMLDLILETDLVDPSFSENHPIIFAATGGHAGIVDRLLQEPTVNPAIKGNAPLFAATRHGHLGVVERLLQDDRVRPNAGNNFPLLQAARYGHLAIVQRLLEEPDVLMEGSLTRALYTAKLNGFHAIDEILINAKAERKKRRWNKRLNTLKSLFTGEKFEN